MKMQSIKSAFASLIAIIAIGFGLTSLASATCISGCPQYPTPAPVTTQFNVSGWSSTEGMAGAVFTGQQGGSHANQEGLSGSRVVLEAQSGGCGPNCGDVNFQYEGFAQQTGKSSSWGSSAGSNQPVTAVGVTQTGVNVGFSTTFPRLAPAGHH